MSGPKVVAITDRRRGGKRSPRAQSPDDARLRAEIGRVVEGFVGFLRVGYGEEISRKGAKSAK